MHPTSKISELLGTVGYVALLGAIATPISTGAQETLHIPERPSCANCMIALKLVTTLGGGDLQEGIICAMGPVSIVVDSRSNYYIAPACDQHQFMVFDANGTYRNSYGKYGQGPGEFISIDRLYVDEGDNLHVFAAELRRTIFSGDAEGLGLGSFRTSPIPGMPRAVVRGPTRQSTVQNVLVRETAGLLHPLHVVDEDGSVVRSFGGSTDPGNSPGSEFRALAAGGGSTVWAAHYQRYQIDLWDASHGKLLKVLSSAPSWFAPWTEYDPADPPARLSAVREDETGLLWLLFVVADSDAPAYRPPVTEGPPRGDGEPERWQGRFDSVIQVVDPNSGRLLGSLRSDLLLGRWLGGLATSLRENGDGDLFYELWEVELRRE